MTEFIVKWLLSAIPTLLILIVFSFLLMHSAPDGSFSSDRPLPPEVLANIEAKYNQDDPLPLQIWNYIVGVVTQFDFGPSFQYKDRTVNEIIAQGFPVTLTYGTISLVIAVVFGCALGMTAALKQNSWIDYLAVGISIGTLVLQSFVQAPILVLIFPLWLGWLPGGGWNGGDHDPDRLSDHPVQSDRRHSLRLD